MVFPTLSECLTRVLPTAPFSSAYGLDSWPPFIGVSRFATPYGKGFLHSKTPIYRTPTMLDPLTCVPQMMDGPQCIGESRIAISLYTNLLSPGAPIPRSPILRDPVPRVPPIGRLRSIKKRFYTPQISDERNPDTFQDADTCPTEING
jgi:hypothetical protein